MIEVSGVYKSFGSHHVLHGVETQFERGKTNLIIGLSGSGKTVLLKVISGLLEPDSGSVLFEGENVSAMTPAERAPIQQQMGMLFQGSALFDSLTVEENVRFPLQLYTRMSNREMRLRVEELLERVELSHAIALYPSDLSGGMRKRVAIARALAPRPKYLLCDEPNSGLDPKTGLVIDALIHDLTAEYNMTTLVNTHDMNSVLAIGDKVSFLYQGRVEWTGSGTEILCTENERLNAFVFATPLAQQIKMHVRNDGLNPSSMARTPVSIGNEGHSSAGA